MSITLQLKRISIPMLKLIKQDPLILSLFFDAQWLPESPFWQRSKHWRGDSAEKTKQEARKRFTKSLKDCTGLKKVCNLQALESQLLAEWEMPELDLHKNFPELTYLLAGYVPGYVSSEWTIPEVKSMANQISTDFLPFLVIEKSEWDSLPLVNALGSGTEINFKMSYGNPRYLLMDEVGEILDGLLFLSEAGFQYRYKRESEKTNPIRQIDWEEEEMLDWMTDYFNEILDYYKDTFRNKEAMLIYIT